MLRSKTLILQLALYPISITTSKTKYPANMVLLTESEQLVHISALLQFFNSPSTGEREILIGSF